MDIIARWTLNGVRRVRLADDSIHLDYDVPVRPAPLVLEA